MLVAAAAVAAPGCAQNRAVGRAEMPAAQPEEAPETTVSSASGDRAELARVENGSGKLKSRELSFGEEIGVIEPADAEPQSAGTLLSSTPMPSSLPKIQQETSRSFAEPSRPAFPAWVCPLSPTSS